MSLSLYDLFVTMGPFAKFIVVVLAVMSVISWANAVQKLVQIVRSERQTRKFAPEFSRFLQEEQLDGAIKLAEKQNRSHVARVVGEALSEVKPLLRDRATITAADINSVERAVEREILIVAAELKRGLGILATTGSTAPFVGLLGTVMGIVNAFTGMAASGGGGSLASVSAGIAEALITTAFGLIVAIPAVWLYNYFTTKIDFLSVEMTYTSKELIDYLIKSVGSEFGRSIFTKEFQTQKASQTSGPVSHQRPGGRQGRHQRHAADRRDAGAADHLHDRHAPDRRGLPGHNPALREPRESPGRGGRGQARNRQGRQVLARPGVRAEANPRRPVARAAPDGLRDPYAGQDPVSQGRPEHRVRARAAGDRDRPTGRCARRRSHHRAETDAHQKEGRGLTDGDGVHRRRRGAQLRDQRHAADRRAAGAADHLHDHAADVP